jgi:predicted nucleotidyltransferase
MTFISLQPFRDFFEKKEQIRFAYLFGSYAKNSQTSLSDVDIAVYLDERLDFFTQRLKLMEEISRDIGGRSIDLVVLNDSSLILQYEVISHCVILKDNASERVDFETRVLRNYLDTEPLRHSYIEAVKKAFIRGDQLGQ